MAEAGNNGPGQVRFRTLREKFMAESASGKSTPLSRERNPFFGIDCSPSAIGKALARKEIERASSEDAEQKSGGCMVQEANEAKEEPLPRIPASLRPRRNKSVHDILDKIYSLARSHEQKMQADRLASEAIRNLPDGVRVQNALEDLYDILRRIGPKDFFRHKVCFSRSSLTQNYVAGERVVSEGQESYGRDSHTVVTTEPIIATRTVGCAYYLKLKKRWTFSRIMRYILTPIGAIAALWSACYATGCPPPQRFIIDSQRAELNRLKEECVKEISAPSYDKIEILKCAEQRYREQH